MKKTQFIELLHNIGKTWVSFFSIVMFVALGVGLFLGIHWAARAVEVSADEVYAAQSFHDFDISYPYGITDGNLDDLASVDGVSQVEGGYTSFATYNLAGQGHVARIQSLGDAIDTAACMEGELPAKSDEMALDVTFAHDEGINVGDTVTFDSDDAIANDGMQYLNGRTFTITGFVRLPAYISSVRDTRGMTNLAAGSADCFFVAPVSAFDTSAYKNSYSNAYVRCSATEPYSTFDAAYTAQESILKARLEAVGAVDGPARYWALHDEGQSQIDEGQARIDAGEAQIAAGEQQIADGEAQIADAEVQIADGEAQIADAENQIAGYDAQVAEGEAKLAAALKQLNEYQAKADAATALINKTIDVAAQEMVDNKICATKDEGKAKIQAILDEAATSTDPVDVIARKHGVPDEFITPESTKNAQEALDSYKDYRSKLKQLADGWDTYNWWRSYLNDKEQELADGKALLEQKKQELADGKAQLEDAKAQVAQAKEQVAQAKVQITDAKAQLADAKERLSQMGEYDWSVSGRSDNASVLLVNSYHDVTDRLRLTMASLFLLVGLFVCYTAISRIVREQVVSIGTKKALGLRGREITISYLLYAVLTVIIGVIVGSSMGVIVVEGILNDTGQWQFSMGAYPPYFSLAETLQIGLVELVLICLATWLACRRMLKRQAVDLLKGEQPPKNKVRFYEKWALWDRMPLYSQSIVNNFFNDKLRVVGTLVGIAGCTALVVTAMTLYLNVQQTFLTQYENVYAYDASVSMDATDEARQGLAEVVDAAGAQSTPLLRKTLAIRDGNGKLFPVQAEVPDDPESFMDLFHLNNTAGGAAQLGDDGIWISEAYATHQGVHAGDSIQLMDSSGITHEVVIDGIFEYHLNHNEVVMSKECYTQVLGQDATPNTLLIALNGADEDQLVQQFQQVDGFFSYTNDYNSSKSQFDTFQSITRTVVYIYLLLSGLMALVVLLNLTVMFIEEKKRDLIVLMINGFSVRDAKRYIYRDNIALTIIGIILGIILGMVMGYLSVLSIEFTSDAYVLTPSWVACLTGAAASAIFALAVNLISLRRIPRFNLTDINKM